MIFIVIQKVFEKILAFENGLFSVELFNNQYNTIKDELPLITPACCIEIEPLELVTTGLQTQEADLNLRLHLVFDNFQDSRLSIKEKDLEILYTVQRFTEYFHGFVVHEGNSVYTSEFIRRALKLDFEHDQYKFPAHHIYTSLYHLLQRVGIYCISS